MARLTELRLRSAFPAALAVALAALAAGSATQFAATGTDYASATAPAVDALARGDLGQFFDTQPVMGIFSLLVRAPVVAVVGWLGGGSTLKYELGAWVCALGAVAVGVWLAVLMRRRGQPLYACAAAAWLCAIGPVLDDAVLWGHPEEVLAGALALAAVLAALTERLAPAGVLLGLAIATKQSALIAALPVLAVAGSAWLRTALPAGAVAIALVGVVAVGNPGRFADRVEELRVPSPHSDIAPASFWTVWWPAFDVVRQRLPVAGEVVAHERYQVPPWLRRNARAIIVLAALAAGAAFLLRRDRRPEDALALLALVMFLRCVLDPRDFSYYHAPAFAALAAWEGLTRRGLPIVSLLAALAAHLVFEGVVRPPRGDGLAAVYLVWAIPLVGYLAAVTLGPTRLRARLVPATPCSTRSAGTRTPPG